MTNLLFGLDEVFLIKPGDSNSQHDYPVFELIQGDFRFICHHECLDERIVEEVKLIADIKKFGRYVLGLGDTPNFTEFRDGVKTPKRTHYSLSVTPKNMFTEGIIKHIYIPSNDTPFPNVTEPTLLFSDSSDLNWEWAYYKAQEYETYWRSYDQHGNGCFLTPEFMKESLARKVELVLHEDWHHNFTKWAGVQPEPNIDESVATFLGLYGAVAYMKDKFGTSAPEFFSAMSALTDSTILYNFVNSYSSILSTISKANITESEKSSLVQASKEIMGKKRPGTTIGELSSRLPYSKNFFLVRDIYSSLIDTISSRGLEALMEILSILPAKENSAVDYLRSQKSKMGRTRDTIDIPITVDDE